MRTALIACLLLLVTGLEARADRPPSPAARKISLAALPALKGTRVDAGTRHGTQLDVLVGQVTDAAAWDALKDRMDAKDLKVDFRTQKVVYVIPSAGREHLGLVSDFNPGRRLFVTFQYEPVVGELAREYVIGWVGVVDSALRDVDLRFTETFALRSTQL